MILSRDLAKAVEGLALTITGYKIGKRGQSGLCDCIGLIMGAMMQLGHKAYPLHSTNYFARKEMDTLEELDSFSGSLQPGMLLYKAYEDSSDLNERYRSGGRYFTGDLLDYYHVGVVTAVEPLEITHCTSVAGGIKRDASLAGWTHAGRLTGVTYSGDSTEPAGISAVVAAANGKPVRMRAAPDDDGETLLKLPVGEAVTVLADAQGWSKIRTAAGKIGYMMSEFLTSGQHVPTGSMVNIRLERDVAEAALAALETALKGGGDA